MAVGICIDTYIYVPQKAVIYVNDDNQTSITGLYHLTTLLTHNINWPRFAAATSLRI